jgi:hypothetical protein
MQVMEFMTRKTPALQNKAENGSIGADAQCQGKHCHSGETRVSDSQPQPVAQIFTQQVVTSPINISCGSTRGQTYTLCDSSNSSRMKAPM